MQPQTTDDEPISAEEKPKTPESTSEPEASTKPEPKKNLSDNGKGNTEDATAIEAATIPEAGNSADSGGDLVAIAQEKLHEARAASQTILCVATPEALAATIPPDREITLQILQLFADAGDDGADFEAWLKLRSVQISARTPALLPCGRPERPLVWRQIAVDIVGRKQARCEPNSSNCQAGGAG